MAVHEGMLELTYNFIHVFSYIYIITIKEDIQVRVTITSGKVVIRVVGDRNSGQHQPDNDGRQDCSSTNPFSHSPSLPAVGR